MFTFVGAFAFVIIGLLPMLSATSSFAAEASPEQLYCHHG